jgi:ubiquinol-cytochrome c reductase cytochrome c1 subunit
MMKKILIAWMALFSSLVMASAEVHLDKAPINVSNQVSLQRGANLFMNYCFGCHSTKYQRYNRVAEDLGIPINLMSENLIFTGVKPGQLMENAMHTVDAERWFGAPPPDLTLVARVRGADWIYTYLRSFYADDSRPFGVNNLVFPSVGMPHVLEVLQGVPRLVYETRMVDGVEQLVDPRLISDGDGEMSEDEYDQAALDLVNYLVYSAEPVQLERKRLGFWVLGFLAVFFVISYLLKKEYWRDVH